ncbi:hypothetical protein LUU34_00750900 [Aix galericulata]|nr:hypothetical protein LUU34_00750900 [Aix galericulata]
MGTTSLIPSAVRPTTSRTGVPNPSLNSRFSKVVTMPVIEKRSSPLGKRKRLLFGDRLKDKQNKDEKEGSECNKVLSYPTLCSETSLLGLVERPETKVQEVCTATAGQ